MVIQYLLSGMAQAVTVQDCPAVTALYTILQLSKPTYTTMAALYSSLPSCTTADSRLQHPHAPSASSALDNPRQTDTALHNHVQLFIALGSPQSPSATPHRTTRFCLYRPPTTPHSHGSVSAGFDYPKAKSVQSGLSVWDLHAFNFFKYLRNQFKDPAQRTPCPDEGANLGVCCAGVGRRQSHV